jgi:carboxypeptidase PM20D1
MSGIVLGLAIAGLVLLSVLTCLVTVVLFTTLAFKPPRPPAGARPWEPGEVPQAVLKRLSGAIAIPTVSTGEYGDTDFAPFREFIAYIKQNWPLFHETVEFTPVNEYALVFRWKGTGTGRKPIILTAHYDVVPVEQGTEHEWTYPGFSGEIAGGRVWGRGTLDIKSQLTAHLEAAENLMRQGFRPRRDFYFIYGHDEEVGGRNGALQVAEYLESQGLRAEGVLDEGGFVISGALKGVASPIALIGVAEKGFCNYEITVEGEGGHSSMPPAHTSLGTAAALIREIETRPLPPRFTAPVREMLRAAAGEMGFPVRMALANLWLFKPLLFRIFASSPATRAMIATSFAATMAQASDAANVLPQKTRITVNARLLSGDTVDQVEEHLAALTEKVIEQDRGARGKGVPGTPGAKGSRGFTLKKLIPQEASPVSPSAGAVYERLTALVGEFYPNAITAPYLVMGGTDARKYYPISDHVYRFTPILITDEEKNTAHSTDESISAANYGRMIRFFERFIGEFDPKGLD